MSVFLMAFIVGVASGLLLWISGYYSSRWVDAYQPFPYSI
jgi:hypothetical protein